MQVTRVNVNRTRRTHGLDSHPLCAVWRGMKHRCNSVVSPAYYNYGGRGITVCKEWQDDPTEFIKWAEQNGWRLGLEIDRIDNNGNYSPGNCRFVTRFNSAQNKRTTSTVTHNGKTLSISLWKELLHKQKIVSALL